MKLTLKRVLIHLMGQLLAVNASIEPNLAYLRNLNPPETRNGRVVDYVFKSVKNRCRSGCVRLDCERAMVRANRQMQGGSNTYENFADASGVTEGGVLSKLSHGNIGGAAMEAAGRMLGFVARTTQGMNEDVAQRVGRYLLSANPDEIMRLTAAFGQVQRGSPDRGRFVARLVSAANAPASNMPPQAVAP